MDLKYTIFFFIFIYILCVAIYIVFFRNQTTHFTYTPKTEDETIIHNFFCDQMILTFTDMTENIKEEYLIQKVRSALLVSFEKIRRSKLETY